MGLGQVSRGVLVTGTPRPCYRSISIVDDGRLEVCDGAHWAFVMKKVNGPAQAKTRLECATRHPSEASHFFAYFLACRGNPFGDIDPNDARYI